MKPNEEKRNPAKRDIEDEQPIDSVPFYRNHKTVIPLFLVIVAAAAATLLYIKNKREYISTDDAVIDGNRVSVSAKMLGRIDSLEADEGDSVRQGQILFRLDQSDLRALEAQAAASVALARENIRLAKVSHERAAADFDRASRQFKDKVIPAEQYDHIRSEFESAQARQGIAAAQAQAAAAQLGIVCTQLRNAEVQSPMNGVIAKRWALPGDVVQPGQAVFTVNDMKSLWVTANLEENRLAAIHLNDRVKIRVDAYPDIDFSGTVIQIGSNTASQFSLIPPNNAAGNFTKITQRVPVRVSIEPPAGRETAEGVRLMPGMSVEVKVKVR
jgi:membrane fusion protein, multidrug efflux system